MSLYVDIKKKMGSFKLSVAFEAENEVMALLGASGCGKSMTLKCIAGIEKPDSGIIVSDGRVLFDSSKGICIPTRKRKVGYLFQNYALFPNMTVEQNIMCAMRKKDSYELDRLLKNFYIEEVRKLLPSRLSGGQAQRVAIARMLATKPELIMLDEPFSALDSFLKWQLEQELMRVFEEYGKTTLYVSHDRDEVYRLADSIAIMESGNIVDYGKTKDLFESPSTLATTRLTGCKNFTNVEKRDGKLYAVDWGIALSTTEKVNNPVYAGFRAHFFEPVETMEPENVIEAKIERVIEDTFSVIVVFTNASCECNTQWSRLRYELSKEKWQELKTREKLYLKMKNKDILLLEK